MLGLLAAAVGLGLVCGGAFGVAVAHGGQPHWLMTLLVGVGVAVAVLVAALASWVAARVWEWRIVAAYHRAERRRQRRGE